MKEGLALEWHMQKHLLGEIVSVYFGGGTPSLFDVSEVLGWIPLKNAEVTVEANPEESSPELFAKLKAAGVNRISLGVQSLDDRSLNVLERTHDAKKAKQAIFHAYEAGIENITIDLMYDLPDQTESSWNYTLDQLKDLPIQHLSLYNLTIEPHTAFSKRTLNLPKPEESLKFLYRAVETLEGLRFERYEISAFAKPGFQSQHNLGYWTYRSFLGFGPSAFSYWEGERYQNIPNLNKYLQSLEERKSPVHFRERLPYPACFNEQLAVGLRLTKGFLLPDTVPAETQLSIENLVSQGLVSQTGKHLRLTERGKLFYDTVAAEIVSTVPSR